MCYTVKSIDDVRNLVAAARGLAGLIDLDTLTSRACRQVCELVGADIAIVSVCRRPDVLELAATDGLDRPSVAVEQVRSRGLGWLAVELDDTPSVRMLGSERVLEDTPATVLDQSLLAELEDDPVMALAAAHGSHRLTACPVTFGGTPLAALFVGHRTEEPVTARAAELLWEFSASLAPLMVTALTANRAGEIAAQQERARIAQQLHDTAGKMLFTISLTAQGLREAFASPEARETVEGAASPPGRVDFETVLAATKRIEHEAAEASMYLRQAMHTLLPADDALVVGLRRDVESFARRSAIPAETVILGTPVTASDAVDETVLLAVREGLHNVERHASASSVSVTLTYRPLDLAVMVQDDGVGLAEVPTITPLPGKAAGLGIPSLTQRVRALGGELCLRNGEDGGAGLLVTLPLKAA
jgi:signal transduction histidine kinase